VRQSAHAMGEPLVEVAIAWTLRQFLLSPAPLVWRAQTRSKPKASCALVN